MPGQDGFPGKIGQRTAELALYDLRRDPGERYDVKALYPEIVESLSKLADQAREELGDEIMKVEGKNRRQPGRAE
jgi:arylsulfatase